MPDLAKLEYQLDRVIITRCFSEAFNEELKQLPRESRGFDWSEKHWWAHASLADDVLKLMRRHFGPVAVFGHPVRGDFTVDADGTVAVQDSLFAD